MYLSPQRYRAAGFGLDVSDMDDPELRAVLVRASSLVDVYCGIPMQPSRHDFRGGSITGEQHEWKLATEVTPGARRVYLNHRPVQEITGFQVKFTNTYGITIAPTNVYVNKQQGWMEVVSLAAVVSGMYPVGINFGLYTPVAEIDYTYGYVFTVTDEELQVIDGNTYAGIRADWDIDPTIKLDGVEVESGDEDPKDAMATVDFTVNLAAGEVVFEAPRPASEVVTATYTYSLPDPVSEATGIIATQLLGERALAAKDMTGLTSIKVAEVALARTNRGMLGYQLASSIPEQAAALLDPYRYRNIA